MLEILNRYSHGLASVPILVALRERGCLTRLAGTGTVFSAEELAREFSANRGYLDVAIRMMVCLEWLRPTADGRYEATPELLSASVLPARIMELYRFPFDQYVRGDNGESFEPWLEQSERRWDSEHPFLPDYLDGLLVIPLLLALRTQGRLSVDGETLRLDVDPIVRHQIEQLFVAKGWGTRSGDVLQVNRAGRFVIDRIFITATVASYQPMFARADELLFGDAARVFERDAEGHETHVDRTVNVIGSGFQHEKFFSALADLIIRCFEGEDYESQPKYIVDMGCGDGTLLRRLYEAVRDRTRRGTVLDVHPVIPVAVDFNEKALVEASRTLADIDHIAVRGDIGDPAALLETLRANCAGDLHRVLHVRSFLDHDRPYRQPEDRDAAARRTATGGNVYIDAQGDAIPPGEMMQSTVEHLRRWAEAVNEHGLVVLEVHCLPPEVTARYRDESENFHFDVYHAFSHQFLLAAPAFLACAAEAGLFCRKGRVVGFPKNLPFTRITLSHFERRPYIVRQVDDQFVLEAEGQTMASVRCEQGETIRVTSPYAQTASALHDLLQFVEQYWALADAGPLAGLDECRAAVPAADEAPSLASAVAGDVRARVAGYPFAAEDDPRAAERELGTFSFRWLLANLQRLGVMREAGEQYDLDALKDRLGIAPKYHRYFDAVMRRLQDEGLVALSGRRMETTALVPGYALTAVDEQVAEFKRSFAQRYPASVGLMNFTAACLGRYAEVLTGRTEITEVLFENADMDVFAEVFRGDVVSDYFNRIVADAARETVVRLRDTTPKVRILEIGAGTGGTTVGVVEALRPLAGSVEFCFTDISRSFVRNAQRRFGQYPWIEYRALNIEEDLARQGFEPQHYDVIVAANVLHDTRDIERTLAQTRTLLKPGGLLLLNEYTFFKDCLSFSGALLHGWWLFEDPERRLRDSCLMSVPQWGTALEHSGFSLVEAFTLPTQSATGECTQSVMLCEALPTAVSEELPARQSTSSRKVDAVGALVEQHAMALLGKERASAYSAQRPLMDMGLDSVELVELKSLIERGLGVKLTPMFLFQHETPEKLAAALSEMVTDEQLPAGAEALPTAAAVAVPARQSTSSRKVDLVGALVEQHALALLGKERASAYSAQRPLMDMGLDSVELVELKSLMERGLGVKLTPMFLFQHETPEKLAAALSEMVADEQLPAGDDHPAADESAEIAVRPANEDDAVAIVGVACRFPGGAVSAESFWQLLESGRNGIVTLPAGRWSWPSFVDLGGKHRGIDKAGFLERIDEFDAPFFRISGKEAELMDPQQRLLLELSWEAMEDAGHRPSELSGQKIGVFVGVCHGDYRELLTAALDSAESYLGTGSADSLLSNRLSFFYDFKGPSITVDTACSSSLVALHDAVAAIRRGDCAQALVGAANLLCSPTNSVTYYQAGMLSPTGTCRTFDANADGFVRGEGGAMLLLKPLRLALADGDAIYGLVTGTAVNHGGQAASLTAPKPESQAAVVEAAWQAADVPLESVGYIEAHGTGTRLGDPIEISGLIEAFRRLYRARGESWPATPQCGLGSVKTTVGHLEGAAGLAGVLKVLLAIQHRSIPATLNFERLNPDIDLTDSPFYVVAQNQVWPARGKHPRRAGVSSFGFGGANSHVVIEEYSRSSDKAEATGGEYLIPLSAKSDAQLTEQARRLLAFLDSAPNLADVAYTLQVGREPMEERVAFVVESREELAAALHAYVAGDRTNANCYRGQVPKTRATTPRHETRDLFTLASLWVKGAEIDWSRLAAAGRPRRTHLPTYPFARQRYWVAAPSRPRVSAEARLHPLLHRNTSDLREQRFSSTFTGEEFFLAGHRVGGRSLLPAVAYLEMAREAVARAAGEAEARSITVRNLVWMRPLVVGEEPLDVHIGLIPKDGGEIDFEIYSGTPGSSEEVVHARGVAAIGAAVEAPRLDVGALARRYQQRNYSADACYAAFAGRGIEYGGEHRAVEGLRVEADEVVARLSLPASASIDSFVLHPGLMDSGLQATIGFALASADSATSPSLPFELKSAEIYGSCAPAMWAVVRRAAPAGGGVERYDMHLCDDAGSVRIRLSGLTMRSVDGGREKPVEVIAEPQVLPVEGDDTRRRLQATLAQIVSRLAKVKAEDVRPESEFGDLGFDSISYIELVDELNDDFGVELEPTVFFEHRTVEKFSRYLLQTHGEALARHFGRPSVPATTPAVQVTPPSAPQEPPAEKRQRPRTRFTSATPEAAAPRPAAAEATEPIAIIGMSGRFPMAQDVDELWANLLSGRNCISEIPPERWDWRSVYGNPAEDNKTNIKWGGFIDGVYEFDPQFFNISPREAALMDPHQRLLMMYAWKAIEDAGYSPSQLSGSNTAIFFATGISDYGRMIARSKTSIDAFVATGTVASVGPNRMSYYLDLHGPSDPVETACSSSLVAIHRAVAAMRSGECEMAIVGGVNTILTPDLHISFTKAGMLSEDGRCKTFSARADGYVRSEGVAALLLKTLRAAEEAGDHIYGVILGSAENHGGRANTLTSPNPQAQAALLKRAYTEAGVDPSTVSYIEAHGTGTALGDPVEIEGLKSAFFDLYRSRNAPVVAGHCGVGSVKSNIGHLELAAGIAGVIKVLLQMKHKTLVPTLHCDAINPYIHLEGSPFYVVRETAEWRPSSDEKGEVPRRAGVSSFGFGGANAHVVLEEYVPPAGSRLAAPAPSRQAIVLSARAPERLREQAEQLLATLRERRLTDADLADVAYTLQVGREPMEERLGLIVSSIAELDDKLQAFLDGGPQFHRGRAQKGDWALTSPAADEAFQSAVDKWIEQGHLEMLLDLWVKGRDLDWSRLHGGARRRRVSLPTYPFARERYGIETAAWGQAPARTAAAAVLHPLLHTNSSTLNEQSYSATFSGDEFFLSDHQVRVDGRTGHKVLPGVACLEMARAAVEAAVPGRPASTLVELRNAVWVQPIVVTGTTQVSVALMANGDGQIDFEIRTGDAGREIVHCQGQAVVSPRPAAATIDLEQIARRMTQGCVEPAAVYATCARQGLLYGPSFQGLTGIDRGSNELLARLQLPQTVEDASEDYVLHPSLMDSAMQGAVVLLEGEGESSRPRMPFALESLRVASPCSREMLAWVRHAPGSRAGDSVPRLDIDLCDTQGNVCVEMRGLTVRSAGNEVRPVVKDAAAACVLAVPVWQAGGIPAALADYAEHHVVLCDLPQIPLNEVLSLQSVPGTTIAQRYSDHALACFERIRGILKGSPRGRVLLQIAIADHEEGTLLAGLSGLLKTAAQENPRFVGQIILVHPETAAEDLGRYLRDEKTQHPDALVRYGADGTRQVARWQEILDDGTTPPVALRDDGVYLITGGRGGLGVLFAKEILERTRDARVILAGRSEWSGDPQALVAGLAAPAAARVSYRQVDVADAGQVRELIESIRSEHGRLDGIVHGAGVLADGFILEKESTRFGEVLAPKVTGTFNLDQASSDVQLDFFVLLSSVAGAVGNVGQADYAAANGFMDQFAAHRNRQVAAGKRHGRTRSIDWPLWAEGGMQIHPAIREGLEKTLGMQPMQTADGMQAFHRCLALPHDQVVVVAGDPAQIRRALLAEPVLPAEPEARPAPAAVEEPVLVEKTERYLRKRLSTVLQLPAGKIDVQVALSQYGIDSILAMQSINELERTFGTLPKTLFFEHHTVRDLAGYFVANHAQRLNAMFASPSGETVPAVVPSPAAKMPLARRRFSPAHDAAPEWPAQREPVAIVGLSGRYPEAVNIDAYWNNLREGKDCIVPVPADRWDWQAYYDDSRSKTGHHYSKWGGFISGVDEFDPLFFNISPREAQYIDPQERLFLQHAWKAVEDAGYTRARLQEAASERGLSGEVGVYVGVMWSEYQLFGVDADIPDRMVGFAGNVASIANRVSFILNLHGPSMTLDTLCSSSLSAIHYACQDLRLGRTSMAIAGGVNVSVHPNKYLILSMGQFISSDGHCQSFGIGGDGYIPAEGVGAVVLKRLSDAERDGDHIYGVIRSSALNHGGRTNGYTVPNPKAQASVIARALAEAQIDARHISYVEAHGTGTELGDPIEIAALSKAFGEHTGETGFCLIGSAKSNIGHCESAAGIAGLTKVLLQMQHRQIVPSLHSAELNPHIDFPGTPFVVNQSLRPWEAPLIDGRQRPRIAGLSSFGAGGSNAHMIIEEYVAPVREPATTGHVIVPLSARTAEQLDEKARDLLAFITTRTEPLDLHSMAWTLQAGREAMEERLCFAVSSVEELVEKLQAYVAGDEEIEDAYRGAVKRNKETLSLFSADDLQQAIDRWIGNGQFSKLAELWARGIEPDWTRLYPNAKPRQISLPTYPFAKERYWIEVTANKATTAVLHPLLHTNTSDLREQRYDSTFTGRESFLADHQVMGRKVLPGVAYLEMVRAAVEHAAPREGATALELRDTVWVQPVVVDGPTRVSIALSEGEDAIDFEVYSDQDVVHCQGRAVIVPRSQPAGLDLAQLEGQMAERRLDPGAVYDACARLGLAYGPAFRGITAIRRGNGQVLAHLRLPEGVEKPAAYVLHPNLMDSALQACVALFESSSEPRLPFALKSLRVLSPSVTEMVAWVRFANGSALEVEIDLCDMDGNVCVQMRGLSLRALGPIGTSTLLAVPAWQASDVVRGGRIELAGHHVLSLRMEPQEPIERQYGKHALALLERVQTILRNMPEGNVLLQVVVTDELLAGLSGLLKTAALENPRFVGQLIVVPEEMTAEVLGAHLEKEKGGPLEAVVRFENGVRQVLRWQEVAAEEAQPPVAFKDGGVYLITGGRGALGMLFAREILEQTANARVILTGRSKADAVESNRRMSYRQVDLGRRDDVERLIAEVKADYGRLDGILHSAGMISDQFLLKKTSAAFSDVLEPKVAGTVHLDEACRDLELDFFVLFSSFAGAMGNVGQADYAAANGFMDRFAAHRNRQVAEGRRHGRTLSINWPLWDAGGMSIDAASRNAVRQATGMHPMQTATGLRAFHRSLALSSDQVLVVEGDRTQLRRTLAAERPVVPERAPVQAVSNAAATGSADLLEKTQQYFRRQFSELLKVPAEKIDPGAVLEEYGIDSVLALQLIKKLEQTFGPLAKTLLFEYQTIRDLSRYFMLQHPARLQALFAPAAAPSVPSSPAVVPAKPVARRRSGRMAPSVRTAAVEPDAIAIIGLSGRYPEAVDLAEYWENLRDGKDCVVEVPKERWDWREYFSDDRTQSGHHYSKWGGFIAGVDEFDPLFFNISPKEAKYIDPQERLFLQHAWMAIEDAGYTRAGLQASSPAGPVGVYAGVMWGEYQLFGVEASAQGQRLGVGGTTASVANRVSYALNLHGPSMTVDTMCSSSLTAIHIACQDLKQGRCSLAIAGGVNVSIHPNKYLVLSAGQFISSDGHCQSFGEGGDGYIPGEGVGVVLLKRLSEAKRDGDHIYGVIRGSAVNHGGKTYGYTVPNPQAQSNAVSEALAESGMDARHVSYIEAHGTGTKLGDPIEITALSKAFGQYTQDKGFCLIGSAKSNIGHCESAAGMAGLTKVLLQMKHRQIVPSLHSARLNPYIDFDNSPFVVNQTLRTWEPPVIDGRTLPRIAGLSSFGAGGSNAHLIIEEYQAPSERSVAAGDVAIVLSARTTPQLQQKVQDLLEFVRTQGSTLDVAAVAYTLQVGREPMEERLGFVAGSIEQLVARLEAYGQSDGAVEELYRGQVKRNKEALSVFTADPDLQQTVEKWLVNRNLPRLLDLWVKGLDIDWSRLYAAVRPARVPLPVYPFARERYWVDITPARSLPAPSAAILHPLLHSNTSDLTAQSYRSTFTGEELFIAEENGRKVLPAIACLEMARAAIAHAMPVPPETAVLELREVVWAQPVVVGELRPVDIELFAEDHGRIAYEIYGGDGDGESVHCQGGAVWSRATAPAALDLQELERQGQRLVPLRVPLTPGEYVLHPALLDGALRAARGASESPVPRSLQMLRIVSPCTPEMLAWVRPAAGGGAADIDLCDARGNVAVQMRGLVLAPAPADAVETVIEQTVPPVATAPVVYREIPFLTPAAAATERKKPPVITLGVRGATISPAPSAGEARIVLSKAGVAASSTPSPVRLYESDAGVFSIEIAASQSQDVIAHVAQALERVRHEASLKVLVLKGIEHCFRGRGREEYNRALDQKLFQRLVEFPYPVIAALQGDVIGTGFLAAALCDFVVCSEDARYGFTDAERGVYATTAETVLLGERFGTSRVEKFLFGSADWSGRQLRSNGWTCPIGPSFEVDGHAERLASTLATRSQEALRLLKEHLTRPVATLSRELTRVEITETEGEARPDAIAVVRYGRTGLNGELPDLSTHAALVLVAEDADVPDDVALALRRTIVDCEIPVVAALRGEARGNAWLLSQYCDARVYDTTGVYSAASIGPALAQAAAAVFTHRFGQEAASEILLTGADYSGAELGQRGASFVEDSDQVLPAAMKLASMWAKLPRATVAGQKKRLPLSLQESTAAATERDSTEDSALAAPGSIPLQSRVVTATVHPDGVVVVRMEDREARNMFSEALAEGIREVFAHIDGTPSYKVVILTGYDTYFASGGTKESLVSIQEGKMRFTDSGVFHVALECKLPVIAAMQGHGIGAGWSMGMFADIVLLSEESRYVSPYMSYGFTPGAGATYSLTEKLGRDLSRESLLTAQQVTGRELKERGLALRILPRGEVTAAAMTLAKQVARASRGRLIELKRQLTAHVHQQVEETYRREVEMHEKTFVGRADTLAQIHSHFDQDVPAPAVVPQSRPEPAQPATPSESPSSVMATLRTLLANELLLQESDVDDHAQFVDLGLDSITGVAWIRKINETYRTSIEATKVYSHSTLAQLSRYVEQEARQAGSLAAAVVPATAAVPPVEEPVVRAAVAAPVLSRRRRSATRFVTSTPGGREPEPIAVIGMAGQFPQARNLEEFWRNIVEGKNCITQVRRWNVDTYYRPGEPMPGKTYSQWMGALDDYDLFDPLFFNISPTEAECMDPQQRLFLQACWHSIENAGYDPRSLSGSRCGVFVGCGSSDYQQLSREHSWSAQGFTGNAPSILAARISYFLNLRGASMAIDTACSSSLVALANACDSLSAGGSDMALAGGVCVMAGPEMHVKTAQAGMLSPQGQCYAFDNRADGIVPGEGVGVVLLKRLSDAERDGDLIQAVIRGWGVNQDGRTNGITAPNPESQTRLEQDVYDKYGIDPAEIQLIEAHGTGTKLGDPIEVEGLRNAFRKYTQKTDYCAIGSVKSNIGHSLTAAGIAGALKLVLALQRRVLPPTINFERLNEHIELRESPFYVNTQSREWKVEGSAKRQAAISSFGFSGTNAHVVIGEYSAPAEVQRAASAKCLVPISARTTEQLTQKVRDLLELVRGAGRSMDLADIAYTLQVGRAAMDERLGFVVSSIDELAENLQAWLDGRHNLENAHRGRVKHDRESISVIDQDDEVMDAVMEKLVARQHLSKLLQLWVKGLDLDWTRLYGERKPRRVSLPVYPFARERYWIDPIVDAQVVTAGMHPLLHRNDSSLHEQRYSATFTGDEAFLKDHRVRTGGRAAQKVLPGVAYLEMARAAIQQTWPGQLESAALELHDTVWLEPIVIERPEAVSVALFPAEGDWVDYEISTASNGQSTVHCQGRASFIRGNAPTRIDLAQLRGRMGPERLEGSDVYSMFAAMGLHYGPAHQGITAIRVGDQELVAELALPAVVEANRHAYVLHPSLMDSALQASIGLIADAGRVPDHPAVPFALESLRVLSPCTKEMIAWVRVSDGRSSGNLELDVDLCDAEGNVCVQMRGFALRLGGGEVMPLLSGPRLPIKQDVPFDEHLYETLIGNVATGRLSVDDAAELG